MTARSEFVTLPTAVAADVHAAVAAGALLSTLVLHWRERGATITTRGALAGQLRRSSRTELSMKVLRADVPSGLVLVYVDLGTKGTRLTLAALPPAPKVIADEDVVLVAARTRVRVSRPQRETKPSAAYLRDIAALTRAPGVPSGRVAP